MSINPINNPHVFTICVGTVAQHMNSYCKYPDVCVGAGAYVLATFKVFLNEYRLVALCTHGDLK